MINTMPLRGMRDFFPEDMAYRKWFVQVIRDLSDRYGFKEYDGPLLEDFSLYAKKSGEEIVNQQSYTFTDRGGEQVVIRPEMTPTLARMVAQKIPQIKKPIKWYSFPTCLRYEKPQKGRLREFMQYNVDILGVPSVNADAEILAFAVNLMNSLGVDNEEFKIKLSDRNYLSTTFSDMHINPDIFSKLFGLIDRKEKMEKDEFEEELYKLGVTKGDISALIKILESKEIPNIEHIKKLYELLDIYKIKGQVEFDPSIVRGLLYYSSIVFELWANTPNLKRSIFGGGRYDGLVSLFGKGDLPAVGFAVSDVVVAALLKEIGKMPKLESTSSEVFVTVFFEDERLVSYSIKIAEQLRSKGINTEIAIDPMKLDKQMKYASDENIKYVVIAGENEFKERKIVVKDMLSRNQEQVSVNELESFLCKQRSAR